MLSGEEKSLTDSKLPAEADVVLVGGGPIGLMKAIGLKKLDPSLKVVVLEKYIEYQRKHTLEMQPERLKAFMDATDSNEDPDLSALYQQLRKDRHIRTNELEEKLKKLAEKMNVNIVIQTVKEEKIQEQLLDFKETPSLIVGADGTHSTVSRCLFPEGNQIKHEFDYVLQLRFDIQGDYHAQPINMVTFFQDMARQGMIANEYVGRFDGYELELISKLPNGDQQQAKPGKIYLSSDEGIYVVRDAKGVVQTGSLENIDLSDLSHRLDDEALKKRILAVSLAAGHTRPDPGKTPVTMQMMISKEDYEALKTQATSKEPIKPFLTGGYDKVRLEDKEPSADDFKEPDTLIMRKTTGENGSNEWIVYWMNSGKMQWRSLDEREIKPILALRLPELHQSSEDLTLLRAIVDKYQCAKKTKLPDRLSRFVNRYLGRQIKNCAEHGLVINRKSDIRISVNEAPATHAKQIINQSHETIQLLVGDAALGLSYFKGLNAGIEALAKLFTFLSPILKKGLKNNKAKFGAALLEYQHWFLNDFAPKKVKEVASYSTWHIRSFMRVIEALSYTKASSRVEYEYDQKYLISEHFRYQAGNDAKEWDPYPHREYDPNISLGQFDPPIPIAYTNKKMIKLFVDYFKPYKSLFHFGQDLQQPLVGLVNVLTGTLKFFYGLVSWDSKTIKDGFFSFLRGTLELATTPLLVLKCALRGLLTCIFGRPKIEENNGLQRLIQKGNTLLAADERSEPEKIRKIQHICLDINRKYDKASKHGQPTNIAKMQEIREFNKVIDSSDITQFKNYFSLFSVKPEAPQESSSVLLKILHSINWQSLTALLPFCIFCRHLCMIFLKKCLLARLLK